jgi:hypothetical protein
MAICPGGGGAEYGLLEFATGTVEWIEARDEATLGFSFNF